MNRKRLIQLTILTVVLLTAAEVLAAGSGMPWESPVQQVLDSITGPFARAAALIIIALTGLGIAKSEGGDLMKKALNVVMGLSIAFCGVSFGLKFFGFAGGVGF